MPELQELTVQAPDMMHDCFYVKKEGKEYQGWERSLGDGDEIEFFLADENAWLKGTVDSWYIDDASGNAPGANAHFFLIISRDGKRYRYVLHDGLQVRLEAPTDAELVKRSVWCEGGDWEDGYKYSPATWAPCHEHGTRYVTKHGQAVWYCDTHKPDWLN